MIPRLWDEAVGGHGARWTGPARAVSRPLKPGKEDFGASVDSWWCCSQVFRAFRIVVVFNGFTFLEGSWR